jgi:hypothetical protein
MLLQTPNNCTKEYAIDVFITKVNTIEDQYACDSYSSQQLGKVIIIRRLEAKWWRDKIISTLLYLPLRHFMSMLRIIAEFLF